jgi:hypothetical protein
MPFKLPTTYKGISLPEAFYQVEKLNFERKTGLVVVELAMYVDEEKQFQPIAKVGCTLETGEVYSEVIHNLDVLIFQALTTQFKDTYEGAVYLEND